MKTPNKPSETWFMPDGITPRMPHYTTWGHKPTRLENVCGCLMFAFAEGLVFLGLLAYIIQLAKGN